MHRTNSVGSCGDPLNNRLQRGRSVSTDKIQKQNKIIDILPQLEVQDEVKEQDLLKLQLEKKQRAVEIRVRQEKHL